MNRFRSILLSGLVALLMVGMVNAGDVDAVGEQPGGDGTDRSFIGTWTSEGCSDSNEWKCLYLDFHFIWQIPL